MKLNKFKKLQLKSNEMSVICGASSNTQMEEHQPCSNAQESEYIDRNGNDCQDANEKTFMVSVPGDQT